MSISSASRRHQPAPGMPEPGQDPDAPATSTAALPLPNPFLMLKVKEAFAADPALKNAPIDIDVSSGVVHLSGIVRTRYQQTIAIYVTGEINGVHAISNRIRVVPPRRKPDGNPQAGYRNCQPALYCR